MYNSIEEYIEEFSSKEDEVLQTVVRNTYLKCINPRMLSGQILGKFLEFITLMIKPKLVLEIGTFTAYSTICIARALEKNAIIYTVEKNPELEELILKHLNMAKVENKVKLFIADATELLPQIDKTFDMIFIDADKENYPYYYKICKEKLNRGGYIIADNVLWDKKVLSPEINTDKSTEGILLFNKIVAEDNDVEQVIIPLRDGVSLIRKLL